MQFNLFASAYNLWVIIIKVNSVLNALENLSKHGKRVNSYMNSKLKLIFLN